MHYDKIYYIKEKRTSVLTVSSSKFRVCNKIWLLDSEEPPNVCKDNVWFENIILEKWSD